MAQTKWVTFALVIGCAWSGTLCAESSDETTIRRQIAAYAEARRLGDGAAQAAFYTEDADTWLSTTRKTSRGRMEIAAELQLPPNRIDS
jgi:hypothetical protein